MSHSVVCSVKHHHKARQEIDQDKINSVKDYGPADVPHPKVSNRGWVLQDFAVDALALPLVAPEDVEDDERLLEVEEEEESVDAVAFEPSGTHRRLTQAQKIMALDHYKEGGRAISLNAQANFCQQNSKWAGYSRVVARILIAKEGDIRASTGNQSKVKHVVFEREGKYPEMEYHLAKQMYDTGEAGIKYPLWMVRMEALRLMQMHHADAFTIDGMPLFSLSNTWREASFHRKKFSIRKYTSQNKRFTDRPEVMKTVAEFHADMRALQVSEWNDHDSGFASPYDVHNEDEVPIELGDKSDTTVDDIGNPYVYDSTHDEAISSASARSTW
jgi:hypothetical protein